jgi:hypothetical protein
MEERIRELINKYQKRSERNRRNKRIYQSLHYALGYPQIICSSVLTWIGAEKGFNVAAALGLVSTLLSVTIVFFGFQEQVGKFHDTQQQYRDLVLDLEEALLHASEESDFDKAVEIAIEKEKFISGYEVSPSICFDYCAV